MAGEETVKTSARRARRPSAPKGPPCANCDTTLVGAWCHGCGQKAHLHDKLSHLVEEFAEGIAHFDGRLWRSLPLLVRAPGRLSRDWMAGRRVRYVAPLHLFLFAVFLLFLIPNFTGRHLVNFGPSSDTPVGLAYQDNADGTRTPIDLTDPATMAREKAEAPTVLRGTLGLIAKLQKNPEYYGYKIEALAYKLSFVTVPISVFILWLLYAGRRYSLYQHSVVALYGVGFMALVLAIFSLFPAPVSNGLNLAAAVIAPAHAAIHLKGAYGDGWIATLLRTLVLSGLTIVGLALFLLGVVFLGLAG